MLELWFIYDGEQLQFPVLETGFNVSYDTNDEEVILYQSGSKVLRGAKGLAEINLSGHFPDQDYYYVETSSRKNPYEYVELINKWMYGENVIRVVVTSTPYNFPMRIQAASFTENDGTGSVYYEMTLRECPPIEEGEKAPAGEYSPAERRPRNG